MKIWNYLDKVGSITSRCPEGAAKIEPIDKEERDLDQVFCQL